MKARWGSVVGALLLLVCGSVWADEPSMAALKAEIDALRGRLNQLETRLAHSESAAPAASTGLGSVGLSGVQMSGFVDTTLGYNFNTPQTRTNTLRVFDTQSQSFMLNNAELNIEKPVSADSPAGFKTSLMFGTDAEVVGGVTTGLGRTDNEFELKDAYAEYLAPIGEGLDVKVGKFATLHGAEVIESKDNWTVSRSLLFGYAIPFTHTGVRATYPWSKQFSTTVGFDNGWDVVDDNNQGKTIETAFTFTPNDQMSLTTNYMLGPEQTVSTAQPMAGGAFGSNSHWRHLIDVVASYTPIAPLQLKANFDYGVEPKGVGIGETASWVGLAGYARYALTDDWALALRTEWFHDADGVRTAFRDVGTFGTGAINGISGRNLNLWEFTLATEYKLNSHLISRLEYRHDGASEEIFRKNDIGQGSSQDTVALEFIAPF